MDVEWLDLEELEEKEDIEMCEAEKTDGTASAAGGLRCGHRAACAHLAGHGSAAPILLSVPLPHGRGVRPAAGAALCAAAPAERELHPGLQCLQTAVPGVPEAGGNQPAQRGVHCL